MMASVRKCWCKDDYSSPAAAAASAPDLQWIPVTPRDTMTVWISPNTTRRCYCCMTNCWCCTDYTQRLAARESHLGTDTSNARSLVGMEHRQPVIYDVSIIEPLRTVFIHEARLAIRRRRRRGYRVVSWDHCVTQSDPAGRHISMDQRSRGCCQISGSNVAWKFY